jgi:hypothetical protein
VPTQFDFPIESASRGPSAARQTVFFLLIFLSFLLPSLVESFVCFMRVLSNSLEPPCEVFSSASSSEFFAVLRNSLVQSLRRLLPSSSQFSGTPLFSPFVCFFRVLRSSPELGKGKQSRSQTGPFANFPVQRNDRNPSFLLLWITTSRWIHLGALGFAPLLLLPTVRLQISAVDRQRRDGTWIDGTWLEVLNDGGIQNSQTRVVVRGPE